MLWWLIGKYEPQGLRPPSVDGDSCMMVIPWPAVGLPPIAVCASMLALRAPGSFFRLK